MGNALVMHVLNALANFSHYVQHNVLGHFFLAVFYHVYQGEAPFAELTKYQHFEYLNPCVDVIFLIDLRIYVLDNIGVFFTLGVGLT